MTRPAHLVDGHYQELLASGLSNETILASRIWSASAAQASHLLGYGVGPAMAIPYSHTGAADADVFVRVKLDDAGPDGKRYRTPQGARNRLYIPPVIAPAVLADVTM